jgi:hypothetical protein
MIRGSNPGRGNGFFSSPKTSRSALGPHSLQLNEYGRYFPEIKLPGRETDNNTSIQRVRMSGCIYIYTPLYAFMPGTRSSLPSLVSIAPCNCSYSSRSLRQAATSDCIPPHSSSVFHRFMQHCICRQFTT